MSEEKGVYNSSEISELIKALCKAKKDFKPITKDGKNPFLNTKYVTLDAIINATKDALSDNGIVIMHHQEDEADKIYLVTEIIHESGQLKSTKTCMNEYMTVSLNDKGNAKVTPIQVFGATMAYLRRYHIGGLLDIAIDDDVDGNKQGDDKDKGNKQKTTLETLTAKYFKFASGNEVERHKWQADNIGKASTKDWTEADFQKAINLLEAAPPKIDILEKLEHALSAVKTLAELENMYNKGKVNRNKSEHKDAMESLYASRKRQLTIEKLMELTGAGFTAYEIDLWLEQAGDVTTLLSEALATNREAITDITNRIFEFLKTTNKPSVEDEMDTFREEYEGE